VPAPASSADAGLHRAALDAAISDVFFSQLGMPEPVGLGRPRLADSLHHDAVRTRRAGAQAGLGSPDWVLVYGDVNSTGRGVARVFEAGALVTREARLGSRYRAMPEEINRLVTDSCGTRSSRGSPTPMRTSSERDSAGEDSSCGQYDDRYAGAVVPIAEQ
jgi:hypothetical protein